MATLTYTFYDQLRTMNYFRNSLNIFGDVKVKIRVEILRFAELYERHISLLKGLVKDSASLLST